MFNLAELKRRLENLISIGTVSQTKSEDGKSLARVKIGDRETDFFPATSWINSFFKVYAPMRVGEQVIVLSPFGEASSGVIIRSIFNTNAKEPTWANNTTAGVEFEDGTTITYDTSAKELKVDATDKITIICQSASVTADSVDVKAQGVTVNANSVDITATTSNTGDVSIAGALSVTGPISGSGGMAVTGGSGASFGGDVTVQGNISDSKGNLTSHGHPR